MSNDGQKLTVDSMLQNPTAMSRRLLAMCEQSYIMDEIYPRPELTRRQRFVNRQRNRVARFRERVALKIAPWLHD